MSKFNKSNRLAELKAKLEAEQAKINKEISIFESLPTLPIEPKFIHVHRLYGVVASINYSPEYGQSILPYIQELLEAYPAITIHKTASGSTYQSYIPDQDVCKDEYLKDGQTKVTGWLDAGYYLIKMSAVEGYPPSAEIQWYTLINGEVFKIKIDLKEIGHTMICYRLKSRSKLDTEYERTLTNRWNDKEIRTTTSWSSVKGLNPLTVYSPKGLSPFEMFNFN